MLTVFDEVDRFLLDQREATWELCCAFVNVVKKLEQLNEDAFVILEEWAQERGLSTLNQRGFFIVYREDWRDPNDDRYGVDVIVSHAFADAVFGNATELASGVWCDPRLTVNGEKRELRKQFGERLRNLISQRQPLLFMNQREPGPYFPFLVDVSSNVPLIEVVLSEGKYSDFVIAQFERLYPLVEIVDQVYKELVSPQVT